MPGMAPIASANNVINTSILPIDTYEMIGLKCFECFIFTNSKNMELRKPKKTPRICYFYGEKDRESDIVEDDERNSGEVQRSTTELVNQRHAGDIGRNVDETSEQNRVLNRVGGHAGIFEYTRRVEKYLKDMCIVMQMDNKSRVEFEK